MPNFDKMTINTALRQLLHLNFGYSVKTLIDASKSQKAKVKELPFYDAGRYQKLQENPVSIICETCAGGALYHQLGLRFESPFINMRIGLNSNDYFELLNNLDEYMKIAPSVIPGKKYEDFDFTGWEGRIDFPRLWYDDILIHGFHYRSTDEMLEIWERRRKRYRADNVVVLKILYDEADVEKFELLPYKKKLGLYYKKTSYDNIITINSESITKEYAYMYAGYIYNMIRTNEFFKYFDIFSFLTD